MRNVVAFESVTLDNVMQAPGRRDEDTRGGFRHGGWAAPYADDVIQGLAGEGATTTDALLFGRRTYEDFHDFWPKQGDNPFTELLTNTHKYVASRTLRTPLLWENSTLLDGDAAEAVDDLRRGDGRNLLILGSGELVRSLLPRGQVDEMILLIHPLVLGSGRRLFDDGDTFAQLELRDAKTSTTGVVVATYRVRTAKLA